MPTLRYWVAESRTDEKYNIRRKTKRAVIEELERQNFQLQFRASDEYVANGAKVSGDKIWINQSSSFYRPVKAEISYVDLLELLSSFEAGQAWGETL